MKIGVQTWGSEGDLRPFIALADGLSFAGHQVTLVVTDVTGADHSHQLRSQRVSLITVGQVPRTAERYREIGRAIGLERRVPIKQIEAILQHLLQPVVPEMYRASLELCRDNDVVIGHFLVHPLAVAAQKMQRPRMSVFTAPTHPSREYVPAGAPNLGRVVNRVTWCAGEWLTDRLFGPDIRRLFVSEGLAEPRGVMRNVWGSDILNLVAVSPTLFRKPSDWAENLSVVGFLSPAGEVSDWRVPDSIEQFFANGDPPVFATFGSMMFGEPEIAKLVGLVIEAVGLAGCRAIIQADWGRLRDLEVPDTVFRLTRAPHSALMPRCAAAVHHGGAGTSHATALAGIPSVVVAFIADQLFWADRLRRTGIGAKPLRRADVTAKRLARELRWLLEAPGVCERAKEIGRLMRQENGVAKAVELVTAAIESREAEAAGPTNAVAHAVDRSHHFLRPTRRRSKR